MIRPVPRLHSYLQVLIASLLLLGLLPPSVPAQGIRGAADPPAADLADAALAPVGASGSTSRLVQLTATATTTATPVLTVTPTVLPTTTPEPTPAPPSLLAFTKRADPEEVSPGDLITYTLTLTNTGGTLLEGLVVSDTVPAGLAYLPYSADGGEYDPQTRRLTWQVPTLAPGESLAVTFQARVTGLARDPLVNRAEVTGPFVPTPLPAWAETRVALAQAETAVTPAQGGVLTSPDGRVRLEFPPGSVRGQAVARYVARGGQSYDESHQGLLLTFSLELEGNEPRDDRGHVRLAQSVTLTLNLAGVVDLARLEQAGQQLALAYHGQVSTKVRSLVGVPLTVDETTGLATATLNHFSTWSIFPVDRQQHNEPLFSVNLGAQVVPFTGASSYRYPLVVPPGPNGMRPQLRLSYYSGSVDGILANIHGPWVGLGWSLDVVDIVRRINTRPVWDDVNGWWWVYYAWEDLYTLMFNGQAQRLVKGSDGRYHPETEDFLWVERRNDLSVPNETKEYWVIKAKDGTEYRLGYNADSEQLAYMEGYDPGGPYTPENPAYAGEMVNYIAYRWRLDRVQDPLGNTLTATYEEERADTYEGQSKSYDNASYLKRVEYAANGSFTAKNRVEFVLEPRAGVDDETPKLWELDAWALYEHRRLQRIRVSVLVDEINDIWEIVREYVLGYTYVDRSVRKNILLSSITPYGRGGEGVDPALPAVLFGYEGLQNRWVDPANCPPGIQGPDCDVYVYDRLAWVDNGYGGRVEFTYGHIDSPYEWRVLRVDEMRTLDGRGNTARVQYSYANPYWSDHEPDVYNFRGHGNVDVRVLEYDGTTTARLTRYTFYTDDDLRKGQPQSVAVQNGAGQTLRETEYVYNAEYSVPVQGGQKNRFSAFVAPAVVTETVGTRQSATGYGYDEFGNVITETLYGDVSTVEDDRLVARAFHHNTERWIVDRPAWERVFAGRERTADGTEAAMTAWGYDGVFDPGQVLTGTHPITGALTTAAVYHTITTTLTIPISDGTITTTVANPAASYTTAYEYDAYGNRTVVTDAGGDRTMMAYEEVYHTYPLTVTNALGQVVRTDYDPRLGQVITETDANGAVTAYEYDPFGRLTKVIRPRDSVTLPTLSYLYDDFYPGPTTKVQTLYREKSGCEPCVRPILRFYDGLGRVVQIKAESQDGTQMIVGNVTYDARGLVAEESVPYYVDSSASFWDYVTPDTTQPKTSYTYDALGRVAQVTSPDNTTVRIDYDGWKKTVVDEKDHQRVYEGDAFGRLVTVEEYTGTGPYTLYATTGYGYDSLGDLAVVTDTQGVTTTMAYDPLGRKVLMHDPDMGEWAYEYDAVGNLIRQQDARGQIIEFSYDDLNRLTRKRLTAPATQTLAAYGYDGGPNGVGRRAWMDSGGATTAWGYDARGRVITETQRIGQLGTYTTTYGYDAADRLVAMRYPGGEVVTTTYDAQGLPVGLESSLGETLVAGAGYNALGQMTGLNLGSGLQTAYGYYAPDAPNGRKPVAEHPVRDSGPADAAAELELRVRCCGQRAEHQRCREHYELRLRCAGPADGGQRRL